MADGRLTLDFAGSSPQRRGNINAVAPMTHSAVFFAVKVLTDATIPANAGILRPVTIKIPAGSFLDAQPPAAVCAGNTETRSACRHGAEGIRPVRAGTHSGCQPGT